MSKAATMSLGEVSASELRVVTTIKHKFGDNVGVQITIGVGGERRACCTGRPSCSGGRRQRGDGKAGLVVVLGC